MKVLVALSHPVQHFSPAFREVSEQGDVTLEVVYRVDTSDGYFDPGFGSRVKWDVDLMEGYSSQIVSGGWMRVTRQLLRVLSGSDVCVVFGWGDMISRVAILTSIATRTPYVLVGDSTYAFSNRGSRSWLRRQALKLLVRNATGAIGTGSHNEYLYLLLGLDANRITTSYLPVDVDLYQSFRPSREARVARIAEGPMRVGVATKFIERKGVEVLLAAASTFTGCDSVQFSLVGSGPLDAELRSYAAGLRAVPESAFEGFKNQEEMAEWMSSIDLLVVPSHVDFRVLVIAEAFASGTPVLVSSGTSVWGPDDLVEHGIAGWVFERGNPHDLAAKIREIAEMSPVDYGDVLSEVESRSTRSMPATFSRAIEASAIKARERGTDGTE